MGEGDVRSVAADGAGSEQVFAQGMEFPVATDAGQQDSVSVKGLRLPEKQGDLLRTHVSQSSRQGAEIHRGEFVFAAQGDVCGNQAVLDLIHERANAFDLQRIGIRYVQTQLDSDGHAVARLLIADGQRFKTTAKASEWALNGGAGHSDPQELAC